MKIITEWEAKPCRSHIGEIYPKGLWNSHCPISPLYSPLCDTCLASPSWWEQVPRLGEQFKPQFWSLFFATKTLGCLDCGTGTKQMWHFMSILVRLYLSKSHPAQQEKWNPLFQLIKYHHAFLPSRKLSPCSPAHPSEPPALQGLHGDTVPSSQIKLPASQVCEQPHNSLLLTVCSELGVP